MAAPSLQNRTIVRAEPTVTRGAGGSAPVLCPLDRNRAGPAVDAVFAGLSSRSRYLRFHSPVPRLPASVRARLVDVDGVRHAAVLAEVHELGPIGLAEVFGNGSGTADLAVAVVDAWQRRGVGRRLLTAVGALAEEIGYSELRGSVLPENEAMQRLARSVLPWARPWYDGETIQFTAPIGPAAWTVTHEDLLADLIGR